MQELNRFDAISPLYDDLARLFFVGTIRNSQRHFLGSIPIRARILILGGGTGEILPELFNRCEDVEVWYIEASGKMISRAASRLRGGEKIEFVHGTHRDIPRSVQFDVVITNFFLDLFPDAELERVVGAISKSLKVSGLWLVSDFIAAKMWHRAILAIMYRFFALTAGVQTRNLPKWRQTLLRYRFSLSGETEFFGGFIRSTRFCKTSKIPTVNF